VTRPAEGAEPLCSGAGGEIAEADQAAAVQAMFNRIAPRYDLLNHLLSASVDRLWWRRAAHVFRPILENPKSQIVDVCCGTGDMTLALLRLRPKNARPVLAVDFAEAMLARARKKFAAAGFASGSVETIQADALRMPFEDNSADLITTAFGFRNLANYGAGLREFHRILRPGGELGILEFSEPRGWLAGPYGFYFHHVLPRVGRLISGASYEYLPRSVQRFPAPEDLLSTMHMLGFERAHWAQYTLGIAGLYTAVKA
jgi:demethylmenaquinone methyltransferase/2-methoxy-6-polyprenyl-1,4-benzoquinol methylase